MKKIISVVVLLILALGGYKGYQYYDKTYKSETAYAKVPSEVPPLKDTVDSSGKKVANLKTYEYKLSFVTSKGETITIPYLIENEKPQPLDPNSYITAEISKTRVIKGPIKIDKTKIPNNVLQKLHN